MFRPADSHNSGSLNHSAMASPPSFGHVTPLLLLLMLSVSASVGAPPLSSSVDPQQKCFFSGQEYEVGQAWFRRLKVPGADACVHCLCKNDGRVNCSNMSCTPALCSQRDPPDCCHVCEGSNQKEASTAIPNSQQVSCLHNGRVYQDGETFSSNSTGLQAQQPNQCIQCVCQAGLVLCRLKNCPVIKCSNPLSNPSDCCPSCKGENPEVQSSKSSPVLVTIMMADGHSDGGDCTTGGITYSHGSTWHPVIGPFGQMDCVVCKCQNQKIECSRLNCPPTHKLSCSKPMQVPGQCCPLCSEQTPEPLFGDTEISPSSAPESKSKECFPPQTNTIVHRSHASSSTSGYYQYAFQTLGTNSNTRLLSWTVKDGRIGDYSEQHLSKAEFSTLTRTFKFKLLGATRTKFMEKFIRKAKRLPDSCGSRCTTKIQRLERVLHLKEMTCTSPEMSSF